eukprot:TRINITY_DN8372_c0_g1_i1.p1 TRINITY_DN8372_c0_g1~~TRINITY_DN8372_c0_g1_i1.p1  ORF type:complete len:519 (-),score=181.44 TRINITY_DN8372_c0_g1_i1:18-1574(-)
MLILYVHVMNGFTQRARAKMEAVETMSNVDVLMSRWIIAEYSGTISELPAKADFAHLKRLGYIQEIFCVVRNLDEGILNRLARTLPRLRAGAHHLVVSDDDLTPLMQFTEEEKALFKECWQAWRQSCKHAIRVQTLEVKAVAFEKEDIRRWARFPILERVGGMLCPMIRDALELEQPPIYRLPPKGTSCDTTMLVTSHKREVTRIAVSVTGTWLGVPGLLHQRDLGLDAPGGLAAAASEASASQVPPTGHAQWSVEDPPGRLRRAETILRARTSRLIVVIDKAHDWHNVNAIFRTCDALGVQSVWVITPMEGYKGTDERDAVNRRVSKHSEKYLSLRVFDTRAECIAALKAEEGLTVWAADVNDQAAKLELPPHGKVQVPDYVAIVVGHERLGVSREMLDAADLHVYLPLFGFGSSLNLSVATALVVQRIFDLAPALRGAMDDSERDALRLKWFTQLASGEQQLAVATTLARSGAAALDPMSDLRRRVMRDRPNTKSARRLTDAEREAEEAAQMKLDE